MRGMMHEKMSPTMMGGMLVWGFLVTLFALKFVWGWVMPDLFPAAVDQGLVAGDLSWVVSAKVAGLVVLLKVLKKGMMWMKMNKGGGEGKEE